MSFIRAHILGPLRDPAAYRAFLYGATALPLGIAWIVLLAVGWSLSAGLLVTLIGLPLLLGLAHALRLAARGERALLRGLLGADVADPVRPIWQGSILRSLREWLGDAVAWREQVYLVARATIGAFLGWLVVGIAFWGGYLLSAPLHYYASDIDFGLWTVDTAGEAFLAVPVGLILLAVTPALALAAARLWLPIARGLLDARSGPRSTAAGVSRNARRGLAVHATTWLVLNLILIVIWAGTTPGGYFWPVWPIICLGLVLGIHAVSLAPSVIGGGMSRGLRRLVVHAGIMGSIGIFLILIWAITTPGGYFWPAWAILGLAVPPIVHAVVVAVGGGDRAELTERIDVLTTSRAGAVDAQAAELRRIERDLHDGAQARLVALAMDLGIAREKLTGSPEEVRGLIDAAHSQAKRAIAELRDLARGIHPAVLTDRGLPAAIGSLAGAGAIPVSLEVDVEGRLDPPIEAAAYFVVAEGLANAAKHSGATAVRVRVVRDDDRLAIEVRDDGRGGADPGGSGILGLRRRVEAHDGHLRVESPAGGGTALIAEIPCAS